MYHIFFSKWFSTVCDPATTCSGNGVCKMDGSCECTDGFAGDDCNTAGKQINLITPTITHWNVFKECIISFFLMVLYSV